MDLTTFRATYPGLYQQAFDAGAEAEQERCFTLAELAQAANVPGMGREFIRLGLPLAQAFPRLRDAAGASDERARSFFATVDRLGLEPSVTGESQTAYAQRRMAGARRAPVGSAGRDLGDEIVDRMLRARAKAPATPEDQPPAHNAGATRDLGDEVVERMLRARGKPVPGSGAR